MTNINLRIYQRFLESNISFPINAVFIKKYYYTIDDRCSYNLKTKIKICKLNDCRNPQIFNFLWKK